MYIWNSSDEHPPSQDPHFKPSFAQLRSAVLEKWEAGLRRRSGLGDEKEGRVSKSSSGRRNGEEHEGGLRSGRVQIQ
jgi:hypothetical protein